MDKGVSYARLDMSSTERFVSLRQQLGVTSFGMNLILLHAGARGRIHKHAKQEEVYLVLEGTLSLSIEGVERDMSAGQHVGRDGTAFVSWAATEGAPPQETPLPEDLPENERR